MSNYKETQFKPQEDKKESKLKVRAWAKINLGLDVTGRREDGYHLLRSVMQTLDLHDTLEIEESSPGSALVRTDNPELPDGDDNLITRAARAILQSYAPDAGVSIHVRKRIPLAAGLAGGSADAAATLLGIRSLLGLRIPDDELMDMGGCLGADVPYCIKGGTALAEGIGEVLTDLPSMPDCAIVLAKPRVAVSTEEIYRRLDGGKPAAAPDIDAQIEALERHDLRGIAARLGNVLESVTSALCPEVTRIKERLLSMGALGAQMSGSGPTLFGIFDDEKKAGHACSVIKSEEEGTEVFLTRPRTAGLQI